MKFYYSDDKVSEEEFEGAEEFEFSFRMPSVREYLSIQRRLQDENRFDMTTLLYELLAVALGCGMDALDNLPMHVGATLMNRYASRFFPAGFDNRTR